MAEKGSNTPSNVSSEPCTIKVESLTFLRGSVRREGQSFMIPILFISQMAPAGAFVRETISSLADNAGDIVKSRLRR